jgi:hypothetical protein
MVDLHYKTSKEVLHEIVQYLITQKVGSVAKFLVCGIDEQGIGRIDIQGIPDDRAYQINKDISTYIILKETINTELYTRKDQLYFIKNRKTLKKLWK